MKYGIIFDLDGTLWEVIDTTCESVNKIASDYNVDSVSKDTVCSCFGLNKEETALNYFPNLDKEYRLKLMDEIVLTIIKKLKLSGGNIYDGVKETLELLSNNYDLYIVSNTTNNEYIEAFLDGNHVRGYFKNYIAASSINLTKSDAIKKIITDNNINKAIYVGDTIYDLKASNKVGIPFIWCKYGFGKNINCKYYIDKFSEINEVIKKILNHKS